MNRYLKFGLIILTFLLVFLVGAIVYIQMVLPDVGNPPESISLTNSSETLNRGKYLANHVMLCIDCQVDLFHPTLLLSTSNLILTVNFLG